MCSKGLIILLLGCALASANPIQGDGNLNPQSKNNVNIGSWLNDAHYGIRKSFKQTVKPFAQLYDALAEASYVPKYSKKKIEELRILFHEIIDKSRENLSNIENAVLTNTIVNLQRAVEFSSTRPNQNIQSNKHAPHKGNQNLQEITNNQANNNANKVSHAVWSEFNSVAQSVNNMGQKAQGMMNSQIENVKDGSFYFNDPRRGGTHDANRNETRSSKIAEHEKRKKATVNEDAGFFSNLGNTVQRAVDDGVENVKKSWDDWSNNWAAGMKLSQDFFNDFGNKAQETFNNGKNIIDSRMENVQGNLNEWGNKGYELTQDFKNIGNQAQDTFNNKHNGVQNQLNQYVLGNNNLAGGKQGNVFDSRQMLNNIGKQLAQAIAVQMSEIEKNLYKWKNLVESFLSNSESNVQKQHRELHEGINSPGSIGYMPSIEEGIELQINPIEGIFGNFGKKVGGGVSSGVNQLTVGYMPNIAEGKGDQKDSDDGIFSKIGKNVGGNMGSGVDKFAGAVGDFFNKAGKFFG